eukprot:TRINITY_DN74205_c0_g1_i1.p1 TRINITY_DN74205_c0_g1~~TRINITY_DN74205_c0_g1_i1.p1  ORF type:complete len:238 (-),score=101.74 TRINITY_DN74205_c0_g1_i1:101-814(-)
MGENDSFGVNVVFTEFGIHLGKEAEVKEELRVTIRELEQTARDIHTMLQRVHRPGGVKETSGLTSRSRDKFNAVKDLYSQLDTKLPPNSYWKYSQLWQSTTSWIAFLASLTIYLETEALATKEQVEEMLGLATTKSVKLDIEEYLIGLTHLSNELSRLSVNCVTSEDYARPERIADFITSLNSGFRLLNLKNDGLRKKFDGIKYDLKKVEEVVYDLSIRGLNKTAEAGNTAKEEVKE